MALPNPANSTSHVAVYRPFLVTQDIAGEAYTQALDYLRTEFKGNEKITSFIAGRTSIADVEAVVAQAKAQYEAKSKTRRSIWQKLNALSQRIRLYSKVLDTLSQHHPEYVSLAWGTLKFVLVGIINHAELMEEMANALTSISVVLPITKVSAELYQTDQMRDAVAFLYTQIMLFFQEALRWYSKGPAGRAISAIFSPFELRYQDSVKQIEVCAATIESIASGTSRQELRDVHVISQLVHQDIRSMQHKLNTAHIKHENQLTQILQLLTATKSVVDRVSCDTTDMRPRLYDIQLAHIMQYLSPPISPEETLMKQQSLILRHKRKTRFRRHPSDDTSKMFEKWMSEPSSCLCVVWWTSRDKNATATGHALDMINYLRNIDYKVFWVLPSPHSSNASQSTITTMLRLLVFQIIQADPQVLLRFPETLNALNFIAQPLEREWWDLLALLICRLGKCVLVVESEHLMNVDALQNTTSSFSTKSSCTNKLLEAFKYLADRANDAGCCLKVLITGQKPSASDDGDLGHTVRYSSTIKQGAAIRAKRQVKSRRGVTSWVR